jgi:hypothetical protein
MEAVSFDEAIFVSVLMWNFFIICHFLVLHICIHGLQPTYQYVDISSARQLIVGTLGQFNS